MDITGARWGLDGAEAVLRLRALISNGATMCDGWWSRRNPDAAGAFSASEALEISRAPRGS